jgi:hypothetical protein
MYNECPREIRISQLEDTCDNVEGRTKGFIIPFKTNEELKKTTVVKNH